MAMNETKRTQIGYRTVSMRHGNLNYFLVGGWEAVYLFGPVLCGYQGDDVLQNVSGHDDDCDWASGRV
jgi:hypothetical protein